MKATDHDLESFYLQSIPAEFNRELADRARDAEAGGPAEVLHRSMAAVNASIVVRVWGDADVAFYLNVVHGHMSPGSASAQPHLFTLEHDRDSFAALAEASGSSILGFLGGLAGHPDEMRLTSQRVENLGRLSGTFRFELTGAKGFALVLRFAGGSTEGAPDASLVMDTGVYRQLCSAELNAQDAFFSGAIQVKGDMELAIQLALAALAPDLS